VIRIGRVVALYGVEVKPVLLEVGLVKLGLQALGKGYDALRVIGVEVPRDRRDFDLALVFRNEDLAEAFFASEFGATDPAACFLVQVGGESFDSPSLAGAFTPV
jgi:hypothetical protein